MRLDEKRVCDDRPKSTQGSNETELPKLFAKIEVKFDAAKMFLAMQRREVAFNWQFDAPHGKQNRQRDKKPYHNSFP
jgi:hypothetical protein